MQYRTFLFAAVLSAGFLTSPAQADVKAGVDAWSNGDYTTAIKEWRQPAENGDADAQFNMGQAYRLGRGVDMNLATALEWFRKAAQQGHVKASDNYGLVLFQTGKRAEAIPYLKASVERGEPRAQYILGTASFNGEFVEKDWVRAYALMTRAAAAGVPAASRSLTQMDQYISPEQKQQAIALAAQLEQQQAKARDKQMMVLATPPAKPAVAQKPANVQPPKVKPATVATTANASQSHPKSATITRPADTPTSPTRPAIAAKTADTEATPAKPVTPTQTIIAAPRPATLAKKPSAPAKSAGSFNNPDDIPGYVPSVPARGAQPDLRSHGADFNAPDAAGDESAPPQQPLAAAMAASVPLASSAPAPSASGDWRIQLTATDSEAEAKAYADRVEAKIPALAGLQYFLDKSAAPYVRLQAGPFVSKADADEMCATIKAAGRLEEPADFGVPCLRR